MEENAQQNSNMFGGIDFSQYRNWQTYTLPNGQIYYIIPGNAGYLYDPFLSAAKGRPVIWSSPQAALDEKKQKEDFIKKQASPVNQLLPVAAGVGGLVAANKLSSMDFKLPTIFGGAEQATQAAGQAAAQTGGLVQASTAAAPVAGSLGNAAAAPFMGPGGAAYSGPFAEAPVAEAAPGMFSLGNIGAAGNAILPGIGAIGAYDVLSHDYGAGRSGIEGAASGAAIGSFFGPTGAIAGAGIGGLIGLGKSVFFDHESTRDRAQKHTGELLEQGKNDPSWQQYVSGIRQQYNAPPPDPSKPFKGQFGTWEEYKAAGLDPSDLSGVYGNLSTFGPEWAKLTEEQRQAITKGLIDADLYDAHKGEVEITDAARARQIKDQILSGKGPVLPAQMGQAAAQGASGKQPIVMSGDPAKMNPAAGNPRMFQGQMKGGVMPEAVSAQSKSPIQLSSLLRKGAEQRGQLGPSGRFNFGYARE